MKKNSSISDLFLKKLTPFFEQLLKRNIDKKGSIKLILDIIYLKFLNNIDVENFDKKIVKNGEKIDQNYYLKLFEILNNFKFSTKEGDQHLETKTVDPEIISIVFENFLSKIENKDGKNRRKKTGTYYTPKDIVNFMVLNSLKLYLKNRINIDQKDIDKLFSDKIINFNKELTKEIIVNLKKIKIIDPAVGGGAFIIPMVTLIFKILKKLEPNRSEIVIKKDIIKKSIFGIDIEETAIDILKYRLNIFLNSEDNIEDIYQNFIVGDSLTDQIFNKKFDIVIGNPPYIKERVNKKPFIELKKSTKYYSGKMDIWYAFTQFGIDKLKKGGILSFIATNNWITSDGAQKLRDKILSDTKIVNFIDFGEYKVFKNATIQTMILFLEKNGDNSYYKTDYSTIVDKDIKNFNLKNFLYQREKDGVKYYQSLIKKDKFFNNNIYFIEDKIEITLDKIYKIGNFCINSSEIKQGIIHPQPYIKKDMLSYIDKKFNIGDGIFNLNEKELKNLNLTNIEKRLLKPYYGTKELKKYYGDIKNSEWVIYSDKKFNKERDKTDKYPNIIKHLDNFKNIITSDNKPYGLHRARDEKIFLGEKIFSRVKCDKTPIFTYCDFDCYVGLNFNIIKTDRVDLKYLTAILNSKLVMFWLKYRGKMQGDNFQINQNPLKNIPIVKNFDKQNIVIDKVDKIILLKKMGKNSKNIEDIIDLIIYKIYQLEFSDIEKIDPDIDNILSKFNIDKKDFQNLTIENLSKI